MFILLMIIRVIEIIFVKTDQTWIGENILHKICCILLIWIVLDMLRLHWSDLGFSKKGLFTGLKYGLALGISTFFLSYVAEFIVLFVMGKHPSLRFYITNFSLTQTYTNGSSLLAVIVCIIGNIVNVYAEEGLFRGLFCKIGIQYYSQKTVNIIQALLFGIWHITNVINPLLDGSMNIAMVVFMGIGYILLHLWYYAVQRGAFHRTKGSDSSFSHIGRCIVYGCFYFLTFVLWHLLYIFFLETIKTNNNDKIFDKVILITINSSAPVSVTVCKELLIKLLNKCYKKTGNLFLISCLDVSFYVETIIPFSIGYIFINGNLFCFYWEVIVHLLISHYFFCKR